MCWTFPISCCQTNEVCGLLYQGARRWSDHTSPRPLNSRITNLTPSVNGQSIMRHGILTASLWRRNFHLTIYRGATYKLLLCSPYCYLVTTRDAVIKRTIILIAGVRKRLATLLPSWFFYLPAILLLRVYPNRYSPFSNKRRHSLRSTQGYMLLVRYRGYGHMAADVSPAPCVSPGGTASRKV